MLRSHSFTLKLNVNQSSADQPNCNNLAGASTQSQSLTFAIYVLGFQRFCASRWWTMNEKVAKLLFNQFLENDFVLNSSIETQKQIHVTYLNYICDWTAGARTLNIPTGDLFLIASIYRLQNRQMSVYINFKSRHTDTTIVYIIFKSRHTDK